MQRVETLSNLLAEKIQNKASVNELLNTVKMLESELLHLRSITPPSTIDSDVSVVKISAKPVESTVETFLPIEEEKTVELLQVDEAELEAELEEIKLHAAEKNRMSTLNKPALVFDSIEDVPSMVSRNTAPEIKTTEPEMLDVNEVNEFVKNQQEINVKTLPTEVTIKPNTEINDVTLPKEINETLQENNTSSLNDVLAKTTAAPTEQINTTAKEINETIQENSSSSLNDALAKTTIAPVEQIKTTTKEINETIPTSHATSINDMLAKPVNEVSDALKDAPIKDLKKAIGVNERFLYLNELFRGDETMYERSIKTINAFEIYPEAEFWIRRELKLKLGWDDKYQTVKQFDNLIRRRFA
jgi:hypothetical protein